MIGLLLAACEECGALQLRDLYVELALLAGGKEFTSAEIIAHDVTAREYRLRGCD